MNLKTLYRSATWSILIESEGKAFMLLICVTNCEILFHGAPLRGNTDKVSVPYGPKSRIFCYVIPFQAFKENYLWLFIMLWQKLYTWNYFRQHSEQLRISNCESEMVFLFCCCLFKFFAVTSHHFMELLILSVSDFS